MKCKNIQELILTDYLDGEMGSEQLKQVERHLAACTDCREFRDAAKQVVAEPFKNAGKVNPPESVWHQIEETIEERKNKRAVAHFFENLKTAFSVKKPVFALSVVAAILIISVLAIQFLPLRRQSDTKDIVNAYLEEQAEYLAHLDDANGGDFNADFGTGIEDYFLSERNF